MLTARSPLHLAVLVLLLAGCSSVLPGSATTGSEPPTSSAPAPAATPRTGIVAGPSSSAYPIEGRDLRLVRVGPDELALQFEYVNGTDRELRPNDLQISYDYQGMLLLDPQRNTNYFVRDERGGLGRVSRNVSQAVPPKGTSTVTAVFDAPHPETAALAVLIDGLLPVTVPVQPAGSPLLLDDPVLRKPAENPGPYTYPVVCPTTGVGGASAGAAKRTVIRLPSDVLFEFASDQLSPAARDVLAAVEADVGSDVRGPVTVEGHTDGIGSDADNQALSERRAAAVVEALKGVLGPSLSYRAVGFGEKAPVAPNTGPDGSDDPEGRALNRRVEVRIGEVATVAATTPPPKPVSRDLADAGMQAELGDLERVGGFMVARLTVSNPTAQPVDLGTGDNGLAANGGSLPGGLVLVDRTNQLELRPCPVGGGATATWDHMSNPGVRFSPGAPNDVPPGAKVTFWAFYGLPASGVTSLDAQIGGFGRTEPLPVPR